MYLRFVSPLRNRRRDLHMGIFQAAFRCRDQDGIRLKLKQQLISEIEWFKRHLPEPDLWCFNYLDVRGLHRDPVSWFKPSATRMIKHAENLSRLVDEAGIPIRKLASDCPGEVVYEDDFQIVAHAFLHQKPKFR